MDTKEFKNFFSNYSKNVDNADQQAFWRLSDAIIAAIIKKHLPSSLTSDQVVLDAGGGTGRWDVVLAKKYGNKFVVYDLSEDMLAKARENVERAGLSTRISLAQGSLEDMSQIADASVDAVISIYNPISFVEDVDKALKEIYRIIKKGGVVIIMGQGYYNAIASKVNNYTIPPEELSAMEKTSTVQWNTYVPTLKVFSKESLEEHLTVAGFTVTKTYGIPIFAQPGPEDFDPNNSLRSRISSALSDEKYFAVLLDIEMKYNSLPQLVNRGMNIFSVGTK